MNTNNRTEISISNWKGIIIVKLISNGLIYTETRALIFYQHLIRWFCEAVTRYLYYCIFTARKRSLGQGNMFPGVCLSTGGFWSGGCLVPGGVPGPGGAWSWGVPGGDPPGTATAAGSTHSTGMHSCIKWIDWIEVVILKLVQHKCWREIEP